MKMRKPIREELNLTQDEMAMLLNISRSQWALYELRLRELSTMGLVRESQAGRFLATLEINEPKNVPKIAALESERTKFITDALSKNEFDQFACKRKIERIEKDYKAAQKLFKLTDFLLQSEDQANAQQIAALEILKTKAVEVQQKNSPLQILKLEVRQKLLQQEKLLLAEIVTQPFIEKAST